MPSIRRRRISIAVIAATLAGPFAIRGDEAAPESPKRLPTALAWSADGTALAVVEAGTRTIALVQAADGALLKRMPLREAGLSPANRFIAVTPDGKRSAAVGPWSPMVDIFGGDQVDAIRNSRLPLQAADRTRKRTILPRPQALAAAPDSRTLVIACDPNGPDDRTLCLFDLESGNVERKSIPGSSNLRGVAISPDGAFALAVHLVPKSHLPSTQIEQGWVFTNAITCVSLRGSEFVVTLPLDLRTRGFANPEAVTIAPDGRRAYVAHAGADVVSVIDLPVLKSLAESLAREARATNGTTTADDLRLTRRYVRERIAVGADPRAIAVAPDGKLIAVANRLDDSISLIDAETNRVARTIRLDASAAGPESLAHHGERLFHSGALSLTGQFSCASCHPDGHTDGLNWDLPADGFNNFHNTKSLLGLEGTAPYGWLGTSATLRARFTGTLRHLFRHEPTDEESAALEAYLKSLRDPELRQPGESLDAPAVARGKALFQKSAGCAACHRGASLTDGQRHDVGTGARGEGEIDTPSLQRISESGPWLHDGRARTLESIFKEHNAAGMHGHAGDLSDAELADLIEYLRSL